MLSVFWFFGCRKVLGKYILLALKLLLVLKKSIKFLNFSYHLLKVIKTSRKFNYIGQIMSNQIPIIILQDLTNTNGADDQLLETMGFMS